MYGPQEWRSCRALMQRFWSRFHSRIVQSKLELARYDASYDSSPPAWLSTTSWLTRLVWPSSANSHRNGAARSSRSHRQQQIWVLAPPLMTRTWPSSCMPGGRGCRERPACIYDVGPRIGHSIGFQVPIATRLGWTHDRHKAEHSTRRKWGGGGLTSTRALDQNSQKNAEVWKLPHSRWRALARPSAKRGRCLKPCIGRPTETRNFNQQPAISNQHPRSVVAKGSMLFLHDAWRYCYKKAARFVEGNV